MTTINRNDLARTYLGMLQEKTDKEICWFYNQEYSRICVLNKEELYQQMKMWRQLVVDGKVVIHNYNNKQVKTFDGKEWYMLVVQPKVDYNEFPVDPLCLLTGCSVSGFVYNFKQKENRDMVSKWVMRKIKKKEKVEEDYTEIYNMVNIINKQKKNTNSHYG